MLDNCYNIGLSALLNAQSSVNNASNNIANANTPGYQKTNTIYEPNESITINGISIGTGANIVSIESQRNIFLEAQYLDCSADLSMQNAAYSYLSQLDTLFNPTDGGLAAAISSFAAAWNELATDPDSLSGREALLGETATVVYDFNATAQQLENVEAAINTEIQSDIAEANDLIDDLAELNSHILANPTDTQAISQRDQLVRELNEIIGVDVINKEDGQITILTEEGLPLVDGTETHHLAYGNPQTTQSLTKSSTYSGEVQFSGDSSEEILMEFVSAGPDGTAQFKVSLDGGKTWLEDSNGNTMLYTAGDEDASVEIEGVEIWFDAGAGDHAIGDRYTVMPKNGLYWETAEGSLVNITPMTDASGQPIEGRTGSGSLAGLYTTLDDSVIPAQNELDAIAEALIWDTNIAHSQGAGLEHHTGLTGSYSVDDTTAPLNDSGYYFEDNIQAGDLQLVTYGPDGEVSTSAIISIDPATDSLDDVVASINAAFGGELVASVNSEGQLQLSSGPDMSFEIAGDSSHLLAAAGVNTYYAGTDADSIAVDSYVATDTTHINTAMLNDDFTVSSGNNDVANIMAELTQATSTVGGVTSSIDEAMAKLVSQIGADTSTAELNLTYALTSTQFYYDQQASASEVNIDEELVDLTKYQQAYQAAAEIITITRSMMQTVLDMV